MAKQYRQNGPIHRAWSLYPTSDSHGSGYGFQLLVATVFRFLPAGTSETFDRNTPLYLWDTDAGTSIAAGPRLMDIIASPLVIFTILGSGAFFFIREDLHDTALPATGGPDFGDIFWVINGRVEDRQP